MDTEPSTQRQNPDEPYFKYVRVLSVIAVPHADCLALTSFLSSSDPPHSETKTENKDPTTSKGQRWPPFTLPWL